MNNVCPECGGVLNGDRCQFCGAVIVDMAAIDLDKPFFLKFKKGKMIYRSKCMMDKFEVERGSDISNLYFDNEPFAYFHRTPPKITMELQVIPTNGIEFVMIDPTIADKEAIRDVYNKQEDPNE